MKPLTQKQIVVSVVKIVINILLVVVAIPIIFMGLALMIGLVGGDTSDGSLEFFVGIGYLLWGGAMIYLCGKSTKISLTSWCFISVALTFPPLLYMIYYLLFPLISLYMMGFL